jgi:hypothetical protein
MVANVVVSAVNFAMLQAGNWDLRAMWGSMSGLARAVVILLFILSAWSLGVMIDRALMYSAARKQSRVFVQQVAGALREGKLDEAISIAERNKKSHIARLRLRYRKRKWWKQRSAGLTALSPSFTPT